MFTPIIGKMLDNFRRSTNRADATMDVAELRFYDNGVLVRITDKGEVDYFVVAGDGELDDATWFMLDGSSQSIHAANRAAGLKIRDDNVLDYLQFFCDFLEMEDGRMRITGTCVVEFDNRKIVPTMRSTFNGMSDGRFLCAAHVIYNGAVFETEFSISPDGRTVMLSDNPLEPMTVH
jgi:hypothetical protein